MYSKYLECDECGAVLDRRAADDYRGGYPGGTFSRNEVGQLFEYAKSLGWTISDERHVCPKHTAPVIPTAGQAP